MNSLRSVPFILVAVVALIAAGCTTEASPTGGGEGGADGDGTTVNVTLQEWSVIVDQDSVPAGDVTFEITNEGPEDVHEFVIFQTDLAPGDLPVDDTGTVDEEGEGITVVDEVEDIPVGESESLTVDLDAGSYVLVCNIYSEDEQESHYAMGMRTAFTVQ